MLELNLDLYPKQAEFVQAAENEVLYCGGAGAGKSHALVVKMFLRARQPGAREGLARKRNVDIVNTFVEAWRRLIPADLYALHKHEQTISIQGGGVIRYFGCDEPERLGSLEMTGCGIEELSELDFASYQKIKTLVRRDTPHGNQVYGASNPPRTHQHWMLEHFGLVSGKAPRGRRLIRTNVLDGHLAGNEGYVESLKNLSGNDRKRLFEGVFAPDEGVIFENFTDDNVAEREPTGRSILVVDDGLSSPFVCLLVHTDSYGTLHVAREFYKRGLHSLDDKAEVVQGMAGDVEAIVVDSQAADVLEALWKRGLPAVKCKKGAGSVAQGISRIRTLLAKGKSGKPRLTVSEHCPNVVREFRTWSYQDNGEPGRDNNHALDALRYGVAYLHLGAADEGRDEEAAAALSAQTPEPEAGPDMFRWERGFGLDLRI